MRLKKVTQTDPIERLSVSVRRSTAAMLDQYREYYRATYGEEIEKSKLVEEILRELISTDKAFVKHLEAMAAAAPEAPKHPTTD